MSKPFSLPEAMSRYLDERNTPPDPQQAALREETSRLAEAGMRFNHESSLMLQLIVWTAIARRHWEAAGVDDIIDLRIGPAIETLRSLPAGQEVDFAIVDADKTGYIGYYEELVARLSPHGLIAVDNTMWNGQVIDDSDESADTVALREFNDHVARDDRTTNVTVPIGDGITLIGLKLPI